MCIEKIAVILVTYNRKQLLIECIEALTAQSIPIDTIIIVDNASTDGTREYLSSINSVFGLINVVYLGLDANMGGAGGFCLGIEKAYELGFDWVWLMDDDAEPNADALKHLLNPIDHTIIGIESETIGFICSRVIWTDQTVHRMNLPKIQTLIKGKAFNEFEKKGLLRVESCSFVSVLVSMKAVLRVGLPLKEMFIWGDDVEFFDRMTRMGFCGYYCPVSEVLHKTQANGNDSLFEQMPNQLWKSRFGIRNELYNLRKQQGFFTMLKRLVWRISILNLRILQRKKFARLQTVKVNTCASIKALFFYPKVAYLQEKPD